MGDTIEIVQQGASLDVRRTLVIVSGQSYLLNILETKPARAISLVGALDLGIEAFQTRVLTCLI